MKPLVRLPLRGGPLVTSRSDSYYSACFDGLNDGLVLDLGPGLKREMPANRVGVDFDYGKNHPANKGKNVAGRFEQLPFHDETFDHTIASLSVGYSDQKKSLPEAIRVTKTGGDVQIANALRRPGSFFRKKNEELSDHVKSKTTRYGKFVLGFVVLVNGSRAPDMVKNFSENGLADTWYIIKSGAIFAATTFWALTRTQKLVIERSEEMREESVRQDVTKYILDRYIIL